MFRVSVFESFVDKMVFPQPSMVKTGTKRELRSESKTYAVYLATQSENAQTS